jgi:hypothetical protein
MRFQDMSLEELSRYLRDRGCPHIPPAEREANQQQYGPVYAGLLEQALTLISTLERGSLIPAEAVALTESLFAKYMHEFVPTTRGAVARHQAKMAKVELEKTRLMVEQHEARLAAERSAAARLEQEAEAQKAQSYRDRLASDASDAAELQRIRAQENAELIQR